MFWIDNFFFLGPKMDPKSKKVVVIELKIIKCTQNYLTTPANIKIKLTNNILTNIRTYIHSPDLHNL